MAASQIPNLLSMRGRGGGRGRGGPGSGRDDVAATDADPTVTAEKQDQIVRQTDTDANLSRLSAVEAGYLPDPFAAGFAPQAASEPGSSRRMPIINRGTYARTTAIDRLVDGFLASQPDVKKQIISLGAGSDTRFFRLMGRKEKPNVVYHELDFPSNTAQKLALIKKSANLKRLIGDEADCTWTDVEVHCPSYHLHAIDLRTLHPKDEASSPTKAIPQIDPSLPTLVLSECCLTYLKPDATDAVVNYFANTALNSNTPFGLALYEPINPFDAFGKVMISNLAARGIVLQTVHKYSSLEAQKARLRSYGLKDGVGAVDADFLHERWIDEGEKERLNRVEMLDEVEELRMLMRHYCVAWGWRDGENGAVWKRWRAVESQDGEI